MNDTIRPICPGYRLEGDEKRSRMHLWLIAMGGILATVVLALMAGATTVPVLLRDHQHYFFIAERVAAGVPPHVSAFDPKHMLGPIVTGLGIAAGDWVGMPPEVSARVVAIAILALFNGIIGVLVYRATGNLTAGIVATALSVAYLSPLQIAVTGGRPKLLLMLLELLTTWAIFRHRYALSAFLAGLCFLTWQPSLMLAAFVFLVALVKRCSIRTFVSAAVLFVLPIALYESYFWLLDGLEAQLFQSYTFPARYMSHGLRNPIYLLNSLTRIWRFQFGGVHPAPILALITLLLWLVRQVREPNGWRIHDWEPGWLFLQLATYATVAFTIYDHQGPADIYLALPFITVVASLGAAELLQAIGRRTRPRVATLTALLLAVGLLLNAARQNENSFGDGVLERSFTLSDQQQAAAIVDQWIKGGETVYAVNSAHLLGMARQDNWLTVSSFFRGVSPHLRTLSDDPAFVPRDENGVLPSVIVLGQGKPYGWPEWLEDNYEEATPLEFRKQGITVWRLARSAT